MEISYDMGPKERQLLYFLDQKEICDELTRQRNVGLDTNY